MIHNSGITAESAMISALAVNGPQPVWMTLNEARERAFTGEIVFEVDPEVVAYLDNGIVYYAERVSDVSLGRRLLDAGVIDIAQLERGTVRVGDIEHLGRLFDRDPSVDRDAVVVVAETATEELVAELANRAITTVRFTAYRHHPSGVHRWFVAPRDPSAVTRPVSAVSQLDTTVVDELPGLPFAGLDADELTIEWDDPAGDVDELNGFDLSLLDLPMDPSTDESMVADTDVFDTDVFELSLDLAEFTDDPDAPVDPDDHAWGQTPGVIVADDAFAIEDEVDAGDDLRSDADEFEFAVVWPDGSAAPTTDGTDYVDQSLTVAESPVAESLVADHEPVADGEQAFSLAENGELHFEMPPLTLSDEPELADADVPDDVAEAVRRAIAAIESASVPAADAADGSGPVSPLEIDAQLPEIADVAVIEESDVLVSSDPESPVALAGSPASSGFGGFAPPSMATRAEVLYGMMTYDSAASNDSAVEQSAAPTFGESSPAAGVASVVFVDDPVEAGGSGNERSSALRRLIGSLRRKDH